MIINNHNTQSYNKMVYSFFTYHIGCWSLVSKDWNDNIVPRLNFRRIRNLESNFDLLLKWYKRGIKFNLDYMGIVDDLMEKIQYLTGQNTEDSEKNLKDLLGLLYRDQKRNKQSKFQISNTKIIKNFIEHEIDKFFKFNNVVYSYQETQLQSILSYLEKLSSFREDVYNKEIKELDLSFKRTLYEIEANEIKLVIQEYHVKSLLLSNLLSLESIQVGYQLKELIIDSKDFSTEIISSLVNNCPLLKIFNLRSRTEEELGEDETILVDSIIHHQNLKEYSIYLPQLHHSESIDRLIYFLNNNKSITILRINPIFIESGLKVNKLINNNTIRSIHGDFIRNHLITLWESPSSLEHIDGIKFTNQVIESITKFHPNMKAIRQTIDSSEYLEKYSNYLISNIINRNLPTIKSIYFIVEIIKSFDPTPIIKSLKENNFIESISFGSIIRDKNLPLEIIAWNLPNLRKISFSDCGIQILESLLKNDYITDVNFSVSEFVPDFTQILKEFLDSNQNISKLQIGIPQTGYPHHFILDILQNYYINHNSPIFPNNLIIGGFDNFELLKNRYFKQIKK